MTITVRHDDVLFSSWTSDDTANATHQSTTGTVGCFRALTNGQISLTANYSSNVAPVVTAPANQNANEGSSVAFSLGSFTDVAADTPWAVTVAWGDGSTNSTFNATTAGSLGTASHTYADGPATHTVAVTVTDKNGASGQATFRVVVANVAPTITAVTAVPDPVNEGSPTTVTVTATDPAGANDPLSYQFDCDDNGTYEVGPQSANSTTCTFDDGPATDRTINVRVTDGDAGADTDSVDVDVANVAPTATFANGGSVNEGSTGTVSFSNQDDPSDADTTAGFTYSYDFNNDGTFEITDSASDSATVPASYLADGPGSRRSRAGSRTRTATSTTTRPRSPSSTSLRRSPP